MKSIVGVRPGRLLGGGAARALKKLALFAADLVAVGAAVNLALVLRFGSVPPLDARDAAALASLLCVIVAALIFPALGFYNRAWRYASLSDLVAIAAGCLAVAILYGVAVMLWPALDAIPRSAPAITLLTAAALLSGMRLLFRAAEVSRAFRPRARRRPADGVHVPVLVVGPARSTELYLRAVQSDGDGHHVPVGCLTDGDHGGLRIRNVPVLGTPEDFGAVYERLLAEGRPPRHLVFTDNPAKLGAARVEPLIHDAERRGVGVLQVASLTELRKAGAKAQPTLRPIELTDLLERPQLSLDRSSVARLIGGRRVMVTGAGGSIGAELTRQIASLEPALLVVTDASEYNLYAVDLALKEDFPLVPRETLLCNVRDAARVEEIVATHQPELIFHAAALKHVPMVELNPSEGILTNVVGTRNVARAAARAGVAAMVQVSTDKVVNPTSVMGATKRMAELYCQALDLAGANSAAGTRFMTVRFGNVLGSSGSLIPLFQRQLERGGPLTVTDPRMMRYFMTIREAVELTLQASAAGMAGDLTRGTVSVLEMGRPIRIIDIARRMIRLAGYVPDEDIEIEIVGCRPGEKLFEELFDSGEERLDSPVPGVLTAVPQPIPLHELERGIARLEGWARVGDNAMALETLAEILPNYGADASPAGDRAVPADPRVTASLPMAAE